MDASRSDLTIGIVGAGVMGRGIAQIAAEAGFTVLLADARTEAVADAVTFCGDMIRRKAAKTGLDIGASEDIVARIRGTDAGPSSGYEAFAGCDLVIEAVAERMEIKHAVRDGLEAAVGPDCVIATNTSSLSVTGFAAGALRPERIAGFHFFNPVPLMKVVEVIGGLLTDPAVLTFLAGLARRMGHHPVHSADMPGFIVNHAGRAYGTEALRIVQEGIADFETVDRIMTEAAGFRMGPFELMDLTGLDVSHVVMESLYRQFYDEPRFRPVPLTTQRHAAGLFGRKVGRGFYAYRDGKAVKSADPVHALPPTLPPVWVSPRLPEQAARLLSALDGTGAPIERGGAPSDEALILVTPIGADATTTALAEGRDPARTVAVDCLADLGLRRTVMRSPATRPAYVAAAAGLLSRDGAAVSVINDSPGFVAQRILAAIVNVGSDIAQQRIASPDDINRAVELGLGYPAGPLRLGDQLGPDQVMAILSALQDFYGDPRYRPSPWLKRRARLRLPLSAPDAAID